METTDVTQIYNVPTNTWSSGPPLSTPRVFTAAAQVADVLIAAGGHDGVSLLQTVERIQGPPLPVELGGFRVE